MKGGMKNIGRLNLFVCIEYNNKKNTLSFLYVISCLFVCFLNMIVCTYSDIFRHGYRDIKHDRLKNKGNVNCMNDFFLNFSK